jgi:hypothetical protein
MAAPLLAEPECARIPFAGFVRCQNMSVRISDEVSIDPGEAARIGG